MASTDKAQMVFRIRKRDGMDRAEAVALAKTKVWWSEKLEFYPHDSARFWVWKEPKE